MEGPIRVGIDVETQDVAQFELEADEVEKRRARRELDEKVDVAVVRSFAPGVGPEHTCATHCVPVEDGPHLFGEGGDGGVHDLKDRRWAAAAPIRPIVGTA